MATQLSLQWLQNDCCSGHQPIQYNFIGEQEYAVCGGNISHSQFLHNSVYCQHVGLGTGRYLLPGGGGGGGGGGGLLPYISHIYKPHISPFGLWDVQVANCSETNYSFKSQH